MIYLFFGENSYAREQMLAELLAGRETEKFDGETLEPRDLPDLLMGQTLFASERVIVIRDLSENAVVWTELEKYLDKIPEETTVILCETKPDKRTKTYKLLQKMAETREFALPKNAREAEQFVASEAKKRDIKIGAAEIRVLVARAGFDPWELAHALEKLSVLETISTQTIEQVVDESHEAQIFGLFEAALMGNSARIHTQIDELSRSENGHMAFGFLTSQALQLAALQTAPNDAPVAKDLGAHPFALSKLESYAHHMTRAKLRKIIDSLADCDAQMKSSGAEPWSLIETTLQKIAAL